LSIPYQYNLGLTGFVTNESNLSGRKLSADIWIPVVDCKLSLRITADVSI